MERDKGQTRFQRFKTQLYDAAVLTGITMSMRYAPPSQEMWEELGKIVNKKPIDMQEGVEVQVAKTLSEQPPL